MAGISDFKNAFSTKSMSNFDKIFFKIIKIKGYEDTFKNILIVSKSKLPANTLHILIMYKKEKSDKISCILDTFLTFFLKIYQK